MHHTFNKIRELKTKCHGTTHQVIDGDTSHTLFGSYYKMCIGRQYVNHSYRNIKLRFDILDGIKKIDLDFVKSLKIKSETVDIRARFKSISYDLPIQDKCEIIEPRSAEMLCRRFRNLA